MFQGSGFGVLGPQQHLLAFRGVLFFFRFSFHLFTLAWSCFWTFFLIGSNKVCVTEVVATATTAVVTAVTTTAVSGIGTSISSLGIFKLGGAGCSVVSSASVSLGRSKISRRYHHRFI